VLAAASVLLMAATAALLVSVLSSSASDPVTEVRPVYGAAESAPSKPAGGAAHRWRVVLSGLDALRARAYAELRPGLLRRVYTPGSRVLRRDRAILLRYRQRGLRVVGLRMQVLALREEARRDGRVVLGVRDQLTGGTLVGATVRRLLPDDAPDARAITLRRSQGRWRISAVTPA
jgi:hypothetical protein